MAEEKRPDWMTSITSIVNPDDYLLGRKIDKTFELSQKEKAERAKEERIKLIEKDEIKLRSDPILDLERRRREIKMEIIQNPVRLKQFRDWLLKRESLETEQSSSTIDNDISRDKEVVHSRLVREGNLDDKRVAARGSSSKHQESTDDGARRREHKEDKSRHRDSRDDRPRRDHKHDESRHSRTKHRSSHRSRSRSRSPSSRHKHRHQHRDHRSRKKSRSPTYHRC